MAKAKTDTTALEFTLEAARAAALNAASDVWEANGKVDCGSCGGAMLSLKAGAKITKVAIALGIATKSGSEVWVYAPIPDDVRSQNRAIPEASLATFKSRLEDAGYGSAIKKYWTYAD